MLLMLDAWRTFVDFRAMIAMFMPHVYAAAHYSNGTRLHARTQQGKVAELRLELNGGISGGKKDKNHFGKKIALKKIVANMTMSNNDMVALFPDVVNCMQIPSLEIKKMYVYVIQSCISPLADTILQVLLIPCELRTYKA